MHTLAMLWPQFLFLKGSSAWGPGGILWQHYDLRFPESFPNVPQRFFHLAPRRHTLAILWPRVFLKGSSTWRFGGILWQYYGLAFPKSCPKVPQRFLNLVPRRHTLEILWSRVSQRFSEDSSKVPQPGALDAYFGNIMASGFPKVSGRFLKGSPT